MNHCFNVNFRKDPNIKGIDNVIKTYKESLKKITLCGPTYFSFVIEKMIQEVKEDMHIHKEKNFYLILLILSDGNPNDIEKFMKNLPKLAYFL